MGKTNEPAELSSIYVSWEKRGRILNQVQDFPLTALSGGIFPCLLGSTDKLALLIWFPENSHFSSGVFLGHNGGRG